MTTFINHKLGHCFNACLYVSAGYLSHWQSNHIRLLSTWDLQLFTFSLCCVVVIGNHTTSLDVRVVYNPVLWALRDSCLIGKNATSPYFHTMRNTSHDKQITYNVHCLTRQTVDIILLYCLIIYSRNMLCLGLDNKRFITFRYSATLMSLM